MTHPDAFALQRSDLNPFLLAEVGNEMNGSALTILSVLARLGQDPWAEAARLAKLPQSEATACLTQSIGQMPLDSQADANMITTASRLILLLPKQTLSPSKGTGGAAGAPTIAGWLPLALLCASLIFGAVVNMVSVPVTHVAAAAPIVQTVGPSTGIKSR